VSIWDKTRILRRSSKNRASDWRRASRRASLAKSPSFHYLDAPLIN